MRVLLTGPSGFIGRHAIPHLLASGCELHTVDIRPLPECLTGSAHHIIDLLDTRQLQDLMKELRPSHLLHFAWYVTPGKFWISPENVRWLQASLDLITSFLDCGGRRSVIAGSCAEYDWTTNRVLSETGTPIRPSSLYGASKAALQMVHARLAAEAHSSCAWGRIFHLYGPFEPESRLVPSVIRSIFLGGVANCTNGLRVLDFMHVDDVARAFVQILFSTAEGPANIATGRGISIAEVATQIADIMGRPDLVCFDAVPEPNESPSFLVADAARLQSLGFTPTYSLQDGLRQTIGWWKQQPGGRG